MLPPRKGTAHCKQMFVLWPAQAIKKIVCSEHINKLKINSILILYLGKKQYFFMLHTRTDQPTKTALSNLANTSNNKIMSLPLPQQSYLASEQ